MQLFQRPSPDEAEEYFRKGLYHRNRKGKEFDFDLAVECFRRAVKLRPDIAKYHTELGKSYVAAPLLATTYGIGDTVNLRECLQLAVDELNQALNCDPDQIDAYLVLGEAYMYLGQEQKAADTFQLAISTSTFSLFDRIILKPYARRRLKHLKRGTNRQAQPDTARERLEQAILYRNEGKYNLAEKKLMEAFSLAPNWAWLYKTICKLVD